MSMCDNNLKSFSVPPASTLDYTLVSNVVTFSPGSEGSPQCVSIDTTSDEILEEDEQLLVQVESTDVAVLLVNSSITVTILDDDSEC